MKAIVTGASGFIGTCLVEQLRKAGYQVASIGRKKYEDLPENRRKMLDTSNYIQADLDNIDDLEARLIEHGYCGPELGYVFHLAWGGESRLSDLDVGAQTKNISRTISLYEMVARLPAKRFIFCGTMEEAFAEQYTLLNHRNDTKFNRHVVYALAKISARHALKWRYRNRDPDILFGTNSHVMGPGDDKDSFLQVALEKILSGRDIEMSSGEQRFDVINVVDCAKAYIAIAERGIKGQSYWIGSGSPRKLKEYVEEMNEIFPKVNIHYGSMPYNDVQLDEMVFDISRINRDTGFVPAMSFSDSVKELAYHLVN